MLEFLLFKYLVTILAVEKRRDKKRGNDMKRTFVVLMAIMFAGMAVSVQAADVTFKPGSVDLTLEPGNSAVKTLEANGNSVSAAHTIMVSVGADSVLTGDEEITHDWLVPQPNGNVVLEHP